MCRPNTSFPQYTLQVNITSHVSSIKESLKSKITEHSKTCPTRLNAYLQSCFHQYCNIDENRIEDSKLKHLYIILGPLATHRHTHTLYLVLPVFSQYIICKLATEKKLHG